MQCQHGSVQTTSPETWLSPGSGHWAATGASSPAQLVELLNKWLSIKRREKKPQTLRYRQCFQPGRIPRGFHGQDRGDGPPVPGPLLVARSFLHIQD